MKKSTLGQFAVTLTAVIFAGSALATSSSSNALYGAWPSDNGSSTNVDVATSDTKINISNAASLTQKWTTFGLDPMLLGLNAVQSTPVIADGKVYIAEAGGSVKAYTEDGALVWSAQLKDTDIPNDPNGVPEYFDESPILTKDYLFIAGKRMHKLNRNSGFEVVAPKLYDPSGLTLLARDVQPSQLMVAGDKVIYGVSFNDETNGGANNPNFQYAHGRIIAFNQSDLSIAWNLDTTNINGVQYGPGAGTFSGGGVDEKRHLFFIGTGNNYAPPISPLSNSIIAIDYTNGKLKWSYQYEGNDPWGNGGDNVPYDGLHDMDVQGHPQVFSVQMVPGIAASNIDLVGARGKDGTYRIFTREQVSKNVLPIAQIQLDPAAVATGGIQADPVIYKGTMYIISESWIDPSNPTAHTSIDLGYSSQGLGFLSGVLGTVRAIDLRKLVSYGIGQLVQGNVQPTCVGSAPFVPSLSPSGTPICTGTLPSNIIKWETVLPTVAPLNSSGLTYDNGVLFIPSGLVGRIVMVNAVNGSVLGTLASNPYGIPNLGGVSIDNGKIFVPIGVDFGSFSNAVPYGGITAFGLP